VNLNVADYWEQRYRVGKRGSGPSSRGLAAQRKADFVNAVVKAHHVRRVIDWGCGDGEVARRIRVKRYIGLDVSQKAIELCAARMKSPRRHWLCFDGVTPPKLPRGDLALSLDVIYHLVDDDLYRDHMAQLFGSAPLVVIYSTNRDEVGAPHVLHRRFSDDVPPVWEILRRPADESAIGFWVLGEAGP